MANIYELLEQINSAIYGEDVRESIHDAIEQCYEDATGNPNSLSAVLENLFNGTVSGIGEVASGVYDYTSEGVLTPNLDAEMNVVGLKPGTWLMLYTSIFTPNEEETEESFTCTTTIHTSEEAIPESSIITKISGNGDNSVTGVYIVQINPDDELLNAAGKKGYYLYMNHTGTLTATIKSQIIAVKLSGNADDGEGTSLAEQVAQNTADIVALESKSFSLDSNDYLTVG